MRYVIYENVIFELYHGDGPLLLPLPRPRPGIFGVIPVLWYSLVLAVAWRLSSRL